MLSEDTLGFAVVLPNIRPQVGQPDKAFDSKFAALHEYAKAGKAGNNTVKLVADVFAQHLQNQTGLQFSLGVLGTLLSEGNVLPNLS
jgi:hypothetical protein